MRLGEVGRRRWWNFRRNGRAFWSLWIFLGLFFVTLPAELIANDRPLLVRYDGHFYYPVVRFYPETTFGGVFETATDYRDPDVTALIEAKGWILWPPIPYSYDTIVRNLPTPAPSPPTWQNWLGTDDQARDVAARLIYGFRISVLFGLTLTLLSTIVGVAAGAVQGYFGGRIDLFFQRFIEIWSSLPTLYLLIILASIVEPNFWWLLGLLLLFSWMSLVGVVRAEFLRTRNFDYVRAARALGVRDVAIMTRHILPNAMTAALSFLPFILSGAITSLTALDFLGFGLPAGSPSLGEVLNQGKNNLTAPWLGISGFVVIAGNAVPVDLRRRRRARRIRSATHLRRSSAAGRDGRRGGRSEVSALLAIDDLAVHFDAGGRVVEAVRGISFEIGRGETVALVGESGSGKSVTALSILQLLPQAARHPSGSIRFEGEELVGAREDRLAKIRGDRIAMIFQEPMTSLNPLHRVEKQVNEVLLLHNQMSPAAARARTLELLARVGIPDPEQRLESFPHELSGGQRQRVMIAMALANEPDLLVADEPTTALDVTIQAQILALLRELKAKSQMSLLLDHARSRRGAQDGRPRVRDERRPDRRTGSRVGDLRESAAPYTRHLIGAEPRGLPAPPAPDAPVLMEGRDVRVWFPVKKRPDAPHRRAHQGGRRRVARGARRRNGRRRRRERQRQDDARHGVAATRTQSR